MGKERSQKAIKVTWTGFTCNLLLSVFKTVAGFMGNSAAMLADGIHSLSDFITDFIVIIFMRISARGEDRRHQYGHGKFETFAAFIISIVLLGAGIGMLAGGCRKIWYAFHGTAIERPEYIALIAAVISIVVKEILYRITYKAGKEIQSDAVMANAWHHRSDAFSSIGTLMGISGAMFLGESWRILDPLAGIVVSVFIIRIGLKMAKPAFEELLEEALPEDNLEEIEKIISNTEGVKDFHNLKTRKNGGMYIIDVHILVNPAISIIDAHNIATEMEQKLRKRFGEDTQIYTHVEPFFQYGVHQ